VSLVLEPQAHEVSVNEPKSASTPGPTPAPDSVPNDPPREESNAADFPLTVIESRGGFSLVDLTEIYRYRELFYCLIQRELKLRYKQTILGVGWSLFQPLTTVLVFIFMAKFGNMAKDIPNYTLHLILGVIPWVYFAQAIQNGGQSLLANERLVTKVYFPRILLPLSNVGSATVDFLVAMSLAALCMLYYGVVPGWTIIFAPLVVGILTLLASGLAVFLAALIAAQRDFRYLLNVGVQLWMFATPCIYFDAVKNWPAAERFLPLNPMYGIILAFRNLVLGTPLDGHAWYSLGMSAFIAVTVALVGLTYFRRVERTFADTI
jgi:lipopolysaccharide transport system permease protein